MTLEDIEQNFTHFDEIRVKNLHAAILLLALKDIALPQLYSKTNVSEKQQCDAIAWVKEDGYFPNSRYPVSFNDICKILEYDIHKSRIEILENPVRVYERYTHSSRKYHKVNKNGG